MKVFFTCSTKDIDKYKKFYLQTTNTIKLLGHTLTRDWIDYSISVAEEKKNDVPSVKVYTEVMSAVLTADLIIADATVRSMSIGHQITFALQKKKPVLLLHQIDDEKVLENLFISGAKSPLLMINGYKGEKEIPSIVTSFIHKYEPTSKTRFNLVINESQNSYIEWAAFTHKKSKTEIIQDAIDKKMSTDKKFEKYLEL